MDISSNSQMVVCGRRDQISVWNIEAKTKLRQFQIDDEFAEVLKFSSNSKFFGLVTPESFL